MICVRLIYGLAIPAFLTFGQPLTAAVSDQRSNRAAGLAFKQVELPSLARDLQVYAIVQDHTGFVWIATRGGLFRYDGVDFRTFVHDSDDPDSIRSNFVWNLTEDSRHRIWAATWGGGISRFDPACECMTHFMHAPDAAASITSNNVWTVFEATDRSIWIGTENGLSRLNDDDRTFTHYEHDPSDPRSIAGNSISSISEDPSGHLWIGVYGAGVDRFDRSQDRFDHFPMAYGVWDVEVDKSGDVWAATEHGLHRLTPGKDAFEPIGLQGDRPSFLENLHITDVTEDELGRLWIGTWGDGLHILSTDREILDTYQYDPRRATSIAHNTVTRVLVDRYDVAWAATDGGVSKADPLEHRFTTIRFEPGNETWLAAPGVESLFEDSARRLWIGTDGGGLNMLPPHSDAMRLYQNDPDNSSSLIDNTITSIAPAELGNLWVGTRGGLQRFKSKTHKRDSVWDRGVIQPS